MYTESFVLHTTSKVKANLVSLFHLLIQCNRILEVCGKNVKVRVTNDLHRFAFVAFRCYSLLSEQGQCMDIVGIWMIYLINHDFQRSIDQENKNKKTKQELQFSIQENSSLFQVRKNKLKLRIF